MTQMLDLLFNQPNFQNVLKKMTADSAQLITGIAGSARAGLIAGIAKKQTKTVIFTANLHQANQLREDLRVFYPEEKLFIYNVNDMIVAQQSIASPEEQAERVEALEFLLSNKTGIVLIPIAGARRLLPPKEIYQKAHLTINLDGEIELEQLMNQLVSMGYKREQIVASPGEFSVRGGIIDVYPLTEKYPIRIELFDIEVDSIRSFDAETQRSIQQLDEVKISPVAENILPMDHWEEATQRIKQAYEKTNHTLEDEEAKERLGARLLPTIEALENKKWDDSFSFYTYYLYENQSSILDYIPNDAIVLYDEYPRILESNQNLEQEESAWLETQLNQHRLLDQQKFSINFLEQQRKIHHPRIYFSLLQKGMGSTKVSSIHAFHYREMQKFFGQMPMIKAEIEGWLNRGYQLIVMTENDERATQVQVTFKDFKLNAKEIGRASCRERV